MRAKAARTGFYSASFASFAELPAVVMQQEQSAHHLAKVSTGALVVQIMQQQGSKHCLSRQLTIWVWR